MKFRIVKEGWMSYNAEASYDGEYWVVLGNFFTKQGAKQECVDFAKFYGKHKVNVIEEFEL
jgi:hypothetical protein